MAKILVADDSKTVRSMVRTMLERIQHEVVGEASNGLEAYDKYVSEKPDIVILDITMPVLDGISAIKKIKEYDKTAKIILCTSNANKKKLNEAHKMGVTSILLKPTNAEQLDKMIEITLGN